MWTRIVVFTAVLVYLIIAGCSLLSKRAEANQSDQRNSAEYLATTRTAREGLPYRSITLQIQRMDWMDKYKHSIDEIAAVGADTVKFVVDTRQENGSSSRIYLDMRMTPTPEVLADLIKYAKGKNLRVILMPIVLLDKPRGGEWRGQIKPENWNTWWESYREMLIHFSWIAQGNGVDVLVIGSELVSTEPKIDEWRETIKKVREVFKGKLTYSANWDHYSGIEFWDQLDLIGMNSYWTLGDDEKASVEDIKKHWLKIKKDVVGFAARKDKPLMFLEVGWCSIANAAKDPWDYTTSDPVDMDLQKRLYEGFFQSWYGESFFGGFSIWEWSPTPDASDESATEAIERGYSPEGKPAEQVLREWLAKPVWQVK